MTIVHNNTCAPSYYTQVHVCTCDLQNMKILINMNYHIYENVIFKFKFQIENIKTL